MNLEPANRLPLAPPLKRCACGRSYATVDEWCALPPCGEPQDYDGWITEMRNCPCGSTLAYVIAIAVDCREDLRS